MRLMRIRHTGILTIPQNLKSILIPDINLENVEKGGEPRRPTLKQSAYVPITNPYDDTQEGFIDLLVTDKVQASYESGQIRAMEDLGWISTTFFDDSALTPPVITNVQYNLPLINGEFQLDGTGFISVAPDVTAVLIVVESDGPPIEIQLSEWEIVHTPYSGTIGAAQIKFSVPFTSTLGQLLRTSQVLTLYVYSDKQLSDSYVYNHVV